MGSNPVESLIEPIYQAACDQSQWPKALQTLAEASGSLCANYLTWRRDAGVGFLASTPEYTGEEEYRAYYGRLDPRRKLLERSPEGMILRCHEHVSDEFVRHDAFYQEFSLRHRRRYALVAQLVRTEQVCHLATVHRSPDQGAFDGEATAVFTSATPHLKRAARIATRIGEIESAKRRSDAALDQLPFGMTTVDAQGRVLSLNAAAEEIIRDADGVVVRAGRLTVKDEQAALRLAESLRFATEPPKRMGRRGAAHIITRQSGRASYRLLVSPMPEQSDIVQGLANQPLALVIITDAERMKGPPEDHLRALFGLTNGEAQVAVGLATGKSAEEIAEDRGVSVGTVRTQLKALLQKTDTARQAELVRLLLTIPTVTSDKQPRPSGTRPENYAKSGE